MPLSVPQPLRRCAVAAICLLISQVCIAQSAKAPAGSATDPLGRQTPRSAVTGFLQSCRTGNYDKASEYLDTPSYTQPAEKAKLAKQLEAILNSANRFDVNSLSTNPEGDGSPVYAVATVPANGHSSTINLSQETPSPNAAPIWLFSRETVGLIPALTPAASNPVVERYLPRFFSTVVFLETPLWKWVALGLAALVLLSVSRLLDFLFSCLIRVSIGRINPAWVSWAMAIVRPIRVMVCLAIFKVVLLFVNPAAVARLYIGRALQLILAWSIAWCVINLIALFFRHVENLIQIRHQVVSRSLLHMGRRTANLVVIVLAFLLTLESWGYNTTTLIAGLGIGGIAVALAAQQTIANIFGGVSVIGDHPVGIGDFGKFGDLVGTVEDIGMRSTRVRTLSRTVVSVPNSSFAAANLENYSRRDKILFNPSFKIKRETPDDRVRMLIEDLEKTLGQEKQLELGSSPVRLTTLEAKAYVVEVFCYVLTDDTDVFYRLQGELLLRINKAMQMTEVELVA